MPGRRAAPRDRRGRAQVPPRRTNGIIPAGNEISFGSDNESDVETNLFESLPVEGDLPVTNENDTTSSQYTRPPYQSSVEFDVGPVTWTGLGKMWVKLFQMIFRLIYKIFVKAITVVINAIMTIVRSAETSIFKFIVRPLFILWHSLFSNGGMLISSRVDQIRLENTWDKELETEETMQKMTRCLLVTFLILLSAWTYAYLHPGFSFINIYYSIADPITETAVPYFDISTRYQKEKPLPNYIKHALPYQNHLADIDAIDRHLASIDFKLAQQSRANDIYYTKAATDLVSLKEKQAKLLVQFNDFHTQLGLYRTDYRRIWHALDENKDRISELPKKTVDDLVRRMVVILLQEAGDSKFAPEVSRMIKENKYFGDLAQQNGATVGEYLLQEIKRFMQELEQDHHNDEDKEHRAVEESDLAVEENGVTVYETDIEKAKVNNYALANKGARIYFERTSSSNVNPEFWTRFLFGLAPLTERHAIKVIEGTEEGCWCLKGPIGYLGILLSEKKPVKYISITHISADMETAPRDFEVYGINRRGLVSDEEFYIGEFQYKNTEEHTQYFRIEDGKLLARIILFRFKSNWGNKDRTDICKVGIYA